MVGWRLEAITLYYTTDRGPLYFEDSGEGQALVLIHGGTLDCRMWDDQFEVFAGKCRTIRYDVRGFGRSRPVIGAYSDVGDLKDLLEHLRVEQPVLLGLSLGGRIALDFALAYPGVAAGLILAAPGMSGYQFTDRQVGEEFEQVSKAVTAGNLPLARELLLNVKFWRQSNPGVRAKLRAILDDYAFSGWGASPADQTSDSPLAVVPVLPPPAIDRLGSVVERTLIIVGDQDVSDIDNIVALMGAGIPGATKVVVPDTGHMLNMQEPEQFNRLVLQYLERL